jgi:hypothetical protein
MTPRAAIKEATIECIECGVKSVVRGHITLGVQVTCPECETWMQVVSLDPIQVDWLYEEPDVDYEQNDW